MTSSCKLSLTASEYQWQYLNQRCPSSLTHMCVIWPQWVIINFCCLQTFLVEYPIKHLDDFNDSIPKNNSGVTRITLEKKRKFSCSKSTCLRAPHDEVVKCKHFPCYWPIERGIHWSPVDSPFKVQWRGAWYFLCSIPDQTVEETIETPVCLDAIALTWQKFTKYRSSYNPAVD